MLKEIGLEADRLKMVQLSSAMGARFAEEAERINSEVAALGPSRLRRRDAPAGERTLDS